MNTRRNFMIGAAGVSIMNAPVWRKALFTVKWQNRHAHIEVDATSDELAEVLRSEGYRGNWIFSYNYRGEEENFRRAISDDEIADLAINDFLASEVEEFEESRRSAFQIHIRVCEMEGSTYVVPHVELDTIRHPIGHYRGDVFSVWLGIQAAWELLEMNDIEIRELV